MADPRYEIDWAPPDISKGAAMLIGIGQANRAHKLAKENAATQRRYADNAEKRASAQALREKHQFEQGKRKRMKEAIESANTLNAQGRHGEAAMLLKLENMRQAPKFGPAKTTAPEIVTPMSAAASLQPPEPGRPGSPFEGPLAPELAHTFATPMAAAANTMPRPQTGTGVTVPEEPPPLPMVAPPEEDAMAMGPPSAERDLMPITLPGKTTPGQPTGAFTYMGPGGEELGTFDPAEEEAFRQKRAAAGSDLYGGIDPKYGQLAQALLAQGVDPSKVGPLIVGAIEHDAARAQKDAALDEQQALRRELELNRSDKLLEAQKNRDAAMARTRESAAGGGIGGPALQRFVAAANALKPGDPITPEVADLANRAGLKPNQIAAEVDRYRNSDNKSMGSGRGPRNAKDLADLDEGLRGLDALISQIESNPKSWDEYRANARSWAQNKGLRESAVGAGLQFIGAMKLRPEEGLKTSDSKTLFQRQEKLNTSIAKGFGGVITEGDREAAASNQANFALDAREKLAQLREMRDNAKAKRDAYISGASAQAPGATSSSQAPVGETKVGADGKTYRKVGPNNWQPVSP